MIAAIDNEIKAFLRPNYTVFIDYRIGYLTVNPTIVNCSYKSIKFDYRLIVPTSWVSFSRCNNLFPMIYNDFIRQGWITLLPFKIFVPPDISPI